MVIGMQGGTKGELDLGALLPKRGAVDRDHAARRGRSTEKAAICAAVVEHVWPLVGDGHGAAVVHATMPLERGRRARTS